MLGTIHASLANSGGISLYGEIQKKRNSHDSRRGTAGRTNSRLCSPSFLKSRNDLIGENRMRDLLTELTSSITPGSHITRTLAALVYSVVLLTPTNVLADDGFSMVIISDTQWPRALCNGDQPAENFLKMRKYSLFRDSLKLQKKSWQFGKLPRRRGDLCSSRA